MDENRKLIDISKKTKNWLNKLEKKIYEIDPTIRIEHNKYYASVAKEGLRKKILQIHPTANQMRVFIPIRMTLEDLIKNSPSTGSWNEQYPCKFTVYQEKDIEIVIQIVFIVITILQRILF